MVFIVLYLDPQTYEFADGQISSAEEETIFTNIHGTAYQVVDVKPECGRNIRMHLQISEHVIQVVTATIMRQIQQLTIGSK